MCVFFGIGLYAGRVARKLEMGNQKNPPGRAGFGEREKVDSSIDRLRGKYYLFDTLYGVKGAFMGKKEKLLAKARRSPANFSYNDLVRLAELFGFKMNKGKGKGAHEMFKNPLGPPPMNFQNRNGKAKEYQVKQLVNYIDDHDLANEE